MHRFLIILLLLSGCTTTFNKRMAWGYRALHWTKLAGEAVDLNLAKWLRSKTNTCVKKYGSKTEGYARCILPTLEVVREWTGCFKSNDESCSTGIVAMLMAAQKASLNSLEIAWNTKKGDVYTAIKPSICILAAFVQTAKNAGMNFGKADVAIEKILALSVSLCK